MKIVVGALLTTTTLFWVATTADSTVDTPVEVRVTCPGVDFTKLSLKADGFSAHALQAAYNDVHEVTDSGDSFLSDLHFDHASKKKRDYNNDNNLDYNYYHYSWGSYYGGWHCNLCPPDDDGLFLTGGSGAALRAWEAKLVTLLLGSPHDEFAHLKSCEIKIAAKPTELALDNNKYEPDNKKTTTTTTTTPPDADDEQETAVDVVDVDVVADREDDSSTDTPVAVLARCPGVDFGKLSIKADGFSAQLLKHTYNKVHELTDNGDSVLMDLHFDHAFKKKKEEEEQHNDNNKDVDYNYYHYSWGSYYGGWHCNLCPPDDDALLAGMFGGSGAALRAWENEFAAGLAASDHQEFAKVKSCEIKIMAKPEGLLADNSNNNNNNKMMLEQDDNTAVLEEEQQDTAYELKTAEDPDDETDTPVVVLVTCPGIDFSKLSIKADGFSAMALAKSYNHVHEMTDNGDSFLTGLHFDHAEKNKKMAKKTTLRGVQYYHYSWGSYYGGWHCNLCPPDDDAGRVIVGGSGAALRAWENEFVTLLLESPHEEFAKVKTCEIKIAAKPAGAAAVA